MIDELRQELENLYKEVIQKQKAVIDTVTEYYGSDLVDCVYTNRDTFIGNIVATTQSLLEYTSTSVTENDYISRYKGSELKIPLETYNNIKDRPVVNVCTKEMIPHFITILKHNCRDYFGLAYIIIKFPEVTVTNEHNKSINIKDLYARIIVRLDGTLHNKIELHRATYTKMQLYSRYAHSHLPGIPNTWTLPCFGRGPIESTMDRLIKSYNIELWGLLCYELEKYVHVESLTGVPYVKLESVSLNNTVCSPDYRLISKLSMSFSKKDYDALKKFFLFTLKEYNYRFAYFNGEYNMQESFNSLWINLSNLFIEWVNEHKQTTLRHVIDENILSKYTIKGSLIYTNSNLSSYRAFSSLIGKKLFTFKGEDVILKVEESGDNDNTVYLLDQTIIHYFITKILFTFNLKYGRETEFKKEQLYV